MQSSTDDMTLHEGMIASEFGVSRTPIRQVLQKLAYERLVETRSGVGTIVSPLFEEERERDLVVLKELFRAAGTCAFGIPLSEKTREKLVAAEAICALADNDAKGYLQTRTELLNISADAAPDPILGDAMRAAHWRQIRWRMAEHAWTMDGAKEELIAVHQACTAQAAGHGLPGLYACLAESNI